MGHAVFGFGDEKLAVALIAPIHGNDKHCSAVSGKEGTDGVEFLGEDSEDDEGEGKHADAGSHVSALEGALSGSNLDEPVTKGAKRQRKLG